MKDNEQRQGWKAYAIGGGCCVLLFVFLQNISSVFGALGTFLSAFSAVFIGAVTAYIINPIAIFFEEKLFTRLKSHKLRWILSVMLTFVLVLGFLSLISIILVPQLIKNVTSFLSNLDTYTGNLKQWASGYGEPITSISNRLIERINGGHSLFSIIESKLLGNIGSIAGKTAAFGGKAMNTLIGIILALYFLFSKEGFKRVLSKLFGLILSPARYYRSKLLFDKFNSIFTKYIIFQLLDSLIIGSMNYIFMKATGMPDALIISVVNAFTNLVPTLGPIVGCGIGVVLLLLTKPTAIIPFVIFTALLQMSDGYIIKPKLFGNALNVPGVIILSFVIVLGKLMGMTGMLLAIPAAAFAVYFYEQVFIPWLELRKTLKNYKKDLERENRRRPPENAENK